jgi:pimeloyl-ACP methyl ester carboxylesterase
MALILMLAVTAAPAAAQAVATERDVTFTSGGVELQGTLMIPPGAGPHPAVVFLHGSGPATRAGARAYAEEFAKLGLASLFFDKRGSGKSGGSWMTASLDDLAADALAALAHARAQKEIDRARVGFWGVSQAGWVATLAASKSADVAFMVLVSGGGASPLESERFSYDKAFERAALTEAERKDAESVLDQYFKYLETGANRDALVARLEQAKTARWYPLARLDQILPSEPNVANWRWVATWDPAPLAAKITIPVLLIFGDRDTSHPHDIAVRRWRDALAKAGNTRATIVVFPGADHSIRVREGFTGTGRPPLADGYQDVMLGWLWRVVVRPPQ